MMSPDSQSTPVPDRPFYQSDFPPQEFAQRRMRVLQKIGSDAVAVLQGAAASGAFDVPRQTNEFYYLTGVEVPHAYLLLDGRTERSILYLPHRDPKHERSEGTTLNADEPALAAELTGADDVRPGKALAADVTSASVLYTPLSPAEGRWSCRDTLRQAQCQIAADPWDSQTSREHRFRERLEALAPQAKLRDLSPVLDRLRMHKSPREIDQMRQAGLLTADAVTEAMRSTRPEIFEYQLAAVADFLYLSHGARGGAYRPIVAGGHNIWNAHYYRNNCPLRSGDLVLMDYAPDCGYYTSDIGRMWPVNGTYSPRQRELYGFIVEYHKTLLKHLRAGVTAAQIMDEAAADMRQVVEQTRWSRPIYEQAARRTLQFRGHLSHGVGMAVHDAGDYQQEPLVPGVVFALDPQMWVPEERLYIRVEDTIAITSGGYENLTRRAPLELDDVEWTMREPGTLANSPPRSIEEQPPRL